jgi:hypothetical protein
MKSVRPLILGLLLVGAAGGAIWKALQRPPAPLPEPDPSFPAVSATELATRRAEVHSYFAAHPPPVAEPDLFLRQVALPYSEVTALALPPDASLLAVAAGKTIHLLDPSSGSEIRHLDAEGPTTTLQFSADGKKLLAAATNGMTTPWDPGAGSILAHVAEHQQADTACLSPDGAHIVTIDRGAIHVWNSATSNQECTIDTPDATAIAASNDLVAVGLHDGSLGLYDLHTAALLDERKHPPVRDDQAGAWILELAFPDDPQTLLFVDQGGIARWNRNDASVTSLLGNACDLHTLPDARFAARGRNGQLYLGTLDGQLRQPPNPEFVHLLAVAPSLLVAIGEPDPQTPNHPGNILYLYNPANFHPPKARP